MFAPKNGLGYHRILAPSAGVRVSPLCLGTMNFGSAWKGYMGECGKGAAFDILDRFHENGGNFVDTANNYQDGESEAWLGEWVESRGVREEMVIATKFTTCFYSDNDQKAIKSNYTGNSTKSMFASVESSLKKLRTSYIDILYMHWWDHHTPIEEIMRSLNTLADQGKILYLGVSDTPAWLVAKANQYARDHGLRPFVLYQGRWSATSRDFERDVIPMCEAEGMGIVPWGVMGSGGFKTEEQKRSAVGRKLFEVSEADVSVSKVLDEIAEAKGTVLTSVALAYVLHKTPYVYPVIGGRTIEQLDANIEALSFSLSQADIEKIEDAYPFHVGFPLNFLFMGQKTPSRKGEDVFLTKMAMQLETVERPRPIAPRKFET